MPSFTAATAIRVRLDWWEWVLIVVAFAYASYHGGAFSEPGLGLLAALGVGIAFGVWRCVRLLGYLAVSAQQRSDLDADA